MARTRKGAHFVWTDRQQAAFEALKACLISAPILGFPTPVFFCGGGSSEPDSRGSGKWLSLMPAEAFAFLSDMNQIQGDREVVIAYASRSLRLSQRRYCTTRREMLAAVVMVHTFPIVSSGGSVHPSYISQFSPVAT